MPDPTGVFGIMPQGGRWTFADPDGRPFFSLAVNHAEESNLKYPGNIGVWRRRYGSREAWIRDGVRRDLEAWGFNTIGWTQEFVYGEGDDWDTPFDAGHSKQWERHDFDLAGMPYCVALPVAEIEGWNGHPVFPDVFSKEWEDRCAYVARSIVADHADSPNLIGYFLADVPAWFTHPTGAFFPGVKPGDDAALAAVARKYYATIHAAIRAYDDWHLILGDRYNGNLGVPGAVLDAMAEHVDVLSVQYFPDASAEGRRHMRDDLDRWHEHTGKPVLIADIGNWCENPSHAHTVVGLPDQAARGEDYVAAFAAVVDEPWLIGWHWCAYVENQARGSGLKSPEDEPYDDLVVCIKEFNTAVAARVSAAR
jgi:hypothetical protein